MHISVHGHAEWSYVIVGIRLCYVVGLQSLLHDGMTVGVAYMPLGMYTLHVCATIRAHACVRACGLNAYLAGW